MIEWFRDLTPDQAFLLAMPFFVATLALMADWLRHLCCKASGTSR
jgi:hypothetical protein